MSFSPCSFSIDGINVSCSDPVTPVVVVETPVVDSPPLDGTPAISEMCTYLIGSVCFKHYVLCKSFTCLCFHYQGFSGCCGSTNAIVTKDANTTIGPTKSDKNGSWYTNMGNRFHLRRPATNRYQVNTHPILNRIGKGINSNRKNNMLLN